MDVRFLMREELTYQSINSVFRFFPIEKRSSLVKSIPSRRRINKRLPFSFSKVQLYESGQTINVYLDSLNWQFTKLGSIGGVSQGTIQTPKGVSTTTNNVMRDLYNLLRFYLHRENSRVKFLEVYYVPIVPNIISFKSIDCFKTYITNRTNIEKNLKEFRNVSIKLLEVTVSTERTSWMQEIQNLRCKELKIKTTTVTPDDIFSGLTVKKMEIEEATTNFTKFEGMCQKFKHGMMQIGSCYSGKFPGHLHGFWNSIKQSQMVLVSGENLFLTKTDNPKTELLLTRRKENGSYTCRVEVVKAGTGNQRKRKEALEMWWDQSELSKIFKHRLGSVVPNLFIVLYLLFSMFFLPLTLFGLGFFPFICSFVIQISLIACVIPPALWVTIKIHAVCDATTKCWLRSLMIVALLCGQVFILLYPLFVIIMSTAPFGMLSLLSEFWARKFPPTNSPFGDYLTVILKEYAELPGSHRNFTDHLYLLGNFTESEMKFTQEQFANIGRTLLDNLDTLVNMSNSDRFWNQTLSM